MVDARVTQAAIEAAYRDASSLRVTQLVVEGAFKRTRLAVRLTQAAIEAAYRAQRTIRVTQMVVEVAYRGSGTPEPTPPTIPDTFHICPPDTQSVIQRTRVGAVTKKASRVGSVTQRTKKIGSVT